MNYAYRDKLMELGQVVRYHGNPGPIQQNIAHHSWGVAWLLTEFHPEPSIALIKAALEHDIAEHLTSDVSYVSKMKYPPLREAMDEATNLAEIELGISTHLPADEEWWLKWADLLEGCLWCRELFREWSFQPYNRRWSAYRDALKKHIGPSWTAGSPTRPASFTKDADYFTRSVFQ